MEALDLVTAFDAKGNPLHVVDSFPAGNGDEEREAIRRNIIDYYLDFARVGGFHKSAEGGSKGDVVVLSPVGA